MREPIQRAGAWLLAVATVGVLGASVVVEAGSRSGIEWLGETGTLPTFSAAISALVGAVIIDRKGAHTVGWLLCFSGLGTAVAHLGGAIGIDQALATASLVEDVLIWSVTWSFFLGYGLVPGLMVFVFPSGQLTTRRWRWYFGGSILAIAIGVVGYALEPGPIEDLPQRANPYGIDGGFGDAMSLISDLAWPLLIIVILGGVVSLRQRRREGSVEERQQIKWILFAIIGLLVFSVFWGVVESFGHEEIAGIGAALFLPLLPLSIGISILKYRLYDLDLVVNKTLVYGSLTVLLAGAYLGVVLILQGILGSWTDSSDLAVVGSTLAVATLARPLRSRVQGFIDRRFYRGRYDATELLESFASRLREEVDLDALRQDLIDVVGEAMQPTHTSLWLRTEVEFVMPQLSEIQSGE